MSNTKLNIYTYDLETMKNCFLFIGKFRGAHEVQVFELSFRKNQARELMQWLAYLKNLDVLMQGYNNLGFDYPIIDLAIKDPHGFNYMTAYNKAQEIIAAQFAAGTVRPPAVHHKDREIRQVDLVKINHFDNKNRATRLKDLQFSMRSPSVEDLPFDWRVDLTSEQIDKLISYGIHDVTETEKFGDICYHLIEMRQELLDTGVLTGDVLNYSDVKIGEKYLVTKIGRNKCYSGSKPKQTFRSSVSFKDVVLDKIYYRTDECQAVLDWFKNTTVHIGAETKPSFMKTIGGLDFYFGLGGVHASVESKVFRSNDTHVIKDVDVSGMYVAVAISNGFAPEHLGQDFSVAYKQLQADRAQYKKGTTMNAVLKLAGNGVYGKSNDVYSCFYDPKYTFTVTSNGQLQLLQLAERFVSIPGLQLIQANTDGITAYVPRQYEWLFECHKVAWEKECGLKLEEVIYNAMWIRDVNNYMAQYQDGKIKRKGAYWYPTELKEYEGYWNKDYSMMAVQKVTERCLIHGWNPQYVMYTMTDPFDFMKREKAKGETKMFIGDKETSKTVRYYVSKAGAKMKKVAPPTGELGSFKRKSGLTDSEYNKIAATVPKGVWDERIHTKNKSVHTIRETSVESGYLVKECNHGLSAFDFADLDYDYYISEVNKLIIEG